MRHLIDFGDLTRQEWDELYARADKIITAPEQYTDVCVSGGFLPLAELFGEENIPEGAIDEYGVRLAETKFWKFYGTKEMFPADAVIALRRVSTMSALTGKSKAEKLHANSAEVFRKIMEYEYPEGYVEPTEETAGTEIP